MNVPERPRRCYEFGPFRLDPLGRVLLRGGKILPLTPKAIETLLVLIENRGRPVRKDELLREVWPDVFIEETTLTSNISVLRKALGEAQGEHTYIETIPKRGYRFVAPVTERDLDPSIEGMRSKLAVLPLESTSPQRAPHSWRARPLGLVAILAVVATLATLLYTTLRPSGRTPTAAASFTQLTDEPGQELYPSLSPDGGSFVYASRASGNWDIYLRRIGGTNTINLTKDCGFDDTQPAFSPNGESVAFRSEREGGGIFVMGATGESVRRVAEVGYHPAWSPDGKQLVYATAGFVRPDVRRAPSQVMVVDLFTGSKRLLTSELDDAAQPNWSPHGQRIAFWAQMQTQGPNRDLWTLPASGGTPVRVTDDPYLDWNPIWSPDGSYLYFSSGRGGSMNLWRMRMDEATGRARGKPEPVTTPSPYSAHMSFSHDGKRMVFMDQSRTVNLRSVPFDPSGGMIVGQPSPVTQGSREVRHMDLSPDGRWLVFTQGEDLFVRSTDGAVLRQLTRDPYRERLPAWAPDGKEIAFYSNRSGKYEVWRIRADGTHLEQVTFEARGATNTPIWSPDGKRLAYTMPRSGVFVLDAEKPWHSQTPQPLAPLSDPQAWFWGWSWSPDGERLAGTRMRRDAVDSGTLIYSFSSRSYQQGTDFGGWPVWLKDSRRLLFLHQGKLQVLDTRTGRTREVFSPAPHEVDSRFALSRDNTRLYFGQVITEADIWLMTAK